MVSMGPMPVQPTWRTAGLLLLVAFCLFAIWPEVDHSETEQWGRQLRAAHVHHKDEVNNTAVAEDEKAAEHKEPEKAAHKDVVKAAVHKKNKTTEADDSEEKDRQSGVYASILKPEYLMPFYFMPVAFAAKTMFTFVAFGLDLKLKPKGEDPETCSWPWLKSWIQAIGRQLLALAFVGMAVNGYIRDFVKFRENMATGFWDNAIIFLICFLTSANTPSSMALWKSLEIESPAAIGLKPKYAACCHSIPCVPSFESWLSPIKYLYAVLLAPYYLPVMTCSQIFSSFIAVKWTCCTGFYCCMSIKTGFCCICSLSGVVLTLGLWAYPKECLAFWWDMSWPVLYTSYMQIWCSIIVPSFFTGMYSCFLGASSAQLCQAMKRSFVSQALAAQPEEQKKQLDEKFPLVGDLDREKELENKKLQKINLQYWGAEHFENVKGCDYSPTATTDAPEDSPASPAEDFNVRRMEIFNLILLCMSSLCILQISVIFFARGLNADCWDDIKNAAQVTVTERHIVTYFQSLKETGEMGLRAGLLKGGQFSEWLNLLWMW